MREISEQTRISTRYLQAIENCDLKRLPGGIFNRSFIKAYAKYIGYDENEALAAYTRTANEQGATPDDVATTPYQSHVYTDGTGTRSPVITLLLTILILAILSLGVYAALHWYQRRSSVQATEATPTRTAPSVVPAAPKPASTESVAPATAAFDVSITAQGADVWMRSRVDDEETKLTNLKANETLEFQPKQRISIQLAKSKTSVLELKVNDRIVDVPVDTSKPLAEIVVNKDDYASYIRKP